jgi:hypothetical protein
MASSMTATETDALLAWRSTLPHWLVPKMESNSSIAGLGYVAGIGWTAVIMRQENKDIIGRDTMEASRMPDQAPINLLFLLSCKGYSISISINEVVLISSLTELSLFRAHERVSSRYLILQCAITVARQAQIWRP